MALLAPLDDVEWSGDFLDALLALGIAVALIAYGFAWGRWRALGVLVTALAVPLIVSDVLYFGADVDPLGWYCEPDECDPGPLPASFGLLLLPAALGMAASGVALRRRRTGTASRAPIER